VVYSKWRALLNFLAERYHKKWRYAFHFCKL